MSIRDVIFSASLALLLLSAIQSKADESTNSSPKITSSDGYFVATLVPEGKILITYCDGTLVRRLDHCAPLAGFFSQDGSLFCAAGRCVGGSGSVKVWRVSDGKLLCKLDNDMVEIPRLSFSHNGAFLACTTGRTRVGLWRISDGKLDWATGVDRGIASVRFDDDDSGVIVQCADKSLRHLSVQSGQAKESKPQSPLRD
jgi:WD40 repeat protein